MNDTKQRIASLIREIAVELETDKRFLEIDSVKQYYRGKRHLGLGVIASLRLIMSDSERVWGEKGTVDRVDAGEGS